MNDAVPVHLVYSNVLPRISFRKSKDSNNLDGIMIEPLNSAMSVS